MQEEIVYLNAPDRRPISRAKIEPSLFIGRQYHLQAQQLPSESHGLCGGFVATAEQGGALPPTSAQAFFWDNASELDIGSASALTDDAHQVKLDADTPMGTNHFVLSHASLSRPTIENDQLQLQVDFEFNYSAEVMHAQLGVLHLLESQCFVMLANGEKHSLLESGDQPPIIFLDPNQPAEILHPLLDAKLGSSANQQHYQPGLSHVIPAHIDEQPVETMTVLEQYQTYFMQRELPFQQENIWTPACAPISWGWSIRIAKRYDDVWTIVRQKLLMPTVGHNGMQMPAWRGNNLGT